MIPFAEPVAEADLSRLHGMMDRLLGLESQLREGAPAAAVAVEGSV